MQLVFPLRRSSTSSARLPAARAQRLQLLSGGIPGECRSRWPLHSTDSSACGHLVCYRGSVGKLCWHDDVVFWQLDMGIPAMTKCCNQLDICYDTCGLSKYDCDDKFRSCLHNICSDLKKSLGFVSKVQGENLTENIQLCTFTFIIIMHYWESQK